VSDEAISIQLLETVCAQCKWLFETYQRFWSTRLQYSLFEELLLSDEQGTDKESA
jgi:hypothetical protein